MLTLPMLPVWLFDFFGAAAAVILACLCLAEARKLMRGEPDNPLWAFFLWLTVTFLALALSRSVGHLFKYILIFSGAGNFWNTIQPFSGGFNTLTFVTVASVTMFFHHIQRIYRRMEANHAELETVSREILNLNRDLETLVMERTMAEMALGVADGIRNPICVIGGFSQLLLRRLTPEDPSRKWLRAIAEETKRMEQMVEKFETLAKEREYFFSQEDLNLIVEDVLAILAPEAEAKRISLEAKLWPHPLIGKLSKHLLRVALSHLLRNAIEATPPGGHIEIITKEKDGQAHLEIKDTGKGMPAEVVEKVFVPFYTTKIGGTGLGLVFVRQIIEEHRGNINISSQPGKGTTVSITLPQRFTERTTKAPPPADQ
ncbi:MAG: sensor histidine kinase [Desulfobacteraceae bacterium]